MAVKTDRFVEELSSKEDDEADFLTGLRPEQVMQLEFSKDCDRVLYSTAFRRLGGVAQVVMSSEVALFHNRLTHTLKTAQVGTRLVNFIGRRYKDNQTILSDINDHGGIDSRVVRAACMAHDLGHPPFGHVAEEELQHISSTKPNSVSTKREDKRTVERHVITIPKDYDISDRFEGNAQSFRIVTKLAFREPAIGEAPAPALNLTRACLGALLKYPWPYADGARPHGAPKDMKWGYYDTESEITHWVFGDTGPSRRDRRVEGYDEPWIEFRTVEAQLMDWSDDISYAVHDVEDFFRIGLIPLDQLRSSDSEWDSFFNSAWTYVLEKKKFAKNDKAWVHQELEKARGRFPPNPYEGFGVDREHLHNFASTTIRDAVRGTEVVGGGIVVPVRAQRATIEILKRLTWYYVIDRPSLQSAQVGQRQLIRSLYSALIEWVEVAWPGVGSGKRIEFTGKGETETSSRRRRELPARLLSYLDVAFGESLDSAKYGENQRISRGVIDYIVSLTEAQAIDLHSRLTGGSVRSMLDTWVQA